MNKNGALVISLDFELLWGIFDLVKAEEKREYFKNTRFVIPKILGTFQRSNIHATWATVGMLFNKNWEEWQKNIPGKIPTYRNVELSAYDFGKENMKNRLEELCFAPDIINEILKVEGQEVGSHTYSHYYCQAEGQSLQQFEADLEKAVLLARGFGIALKSLVFPRNQFNEEYLRICFRNGIKTVRSNPEKWYWKDPASEGLLDRIFRTGDAYNLLGDSKSYPVEDLKRLEGVPLAQKASRFLRPSESNAALRSLKLKRIKSEMTAAAKKKEIYHLWWHPHNFGEKPLESLEDLESLIDHYLHLKQRHQFLSLNMEEIERGDIFNVC